jgi:peptide methionine sulfoxide reductase msrA/msrB
MIRLLTNIGAGLIGVAVPFALIWSGGLSALAGQNGGSRDASPHFTMIDGPPKEVRMTERIYSRAGYDVTPLNAAEKAPLIAKLTPEQRRITQKAGTEAAFCGTLLDNKKQGEYCCVVCGLPMCSSEDKFDSGTGWPSFSTTVDKAHVTGRPDTSYGMVRTEINCARCDAHLGHVFEDGPRPTGLRFCLNSESLVFYETGQDRPAASLPVQTEVAYFAGGCFWGVEHYFQKGDGVINAVSGYMNGETANPTYRDITTGTTGHAEAVKVTYDPSRISYRTLLEAFFIMHDPTTLNRQGPDIGTQYRSGVYAANAEQLAEARAYVAELNMRNVFKRPVVTEIEMAEVFYVAEDYHQDYMENNNWRCSLRNPWPIMAAEAEKKKVAAGSATGG